jgi:chromosome segregation ATPase
MADNIESLTQNVKDLHDELGKVATDVRTLLTGHADLAAKYENLTPKAYVDSQFGLLRQELTTIRADAAGRSDITSMQAQLSSIRLLLEERLSGVASRTEVLARSEADLRFTELKSSFEIVRQRLDAIGANRDSKMWDVLKILLPYAAIGGAVMAVASGRVVFHP